MNTFDATSFISLCNQLSKKERKFQKIIASHGYPPIWSRSNSFASLIHIILEQQVSLASAKAAFTKLKAYTGVITPKKILALTDAELRACYFSRQKTLYARALATAIESKQLQLKKLTRLSDEQVRAELKKIKGIGDWTVDVYLLFVLKRADVFPTGDLAMMNALKEVKQLPTNTTKEYVLALAEKWRPYRSIACCLLWHHYLKTRNKMV
ncbi:MAG: DNA-3-methyladenine glycosylase family protein [Chitinophagaceae bacterium]